MKNTAATLLVLTLVLIGCGQEDTGTLTVSIEDWAGAEGYQVLVLAWDGDELAGAAFGTRIDSDPFTGQDEVHPPDHSENPEGEPFDTTRFWFADDYLWGESARLRPGTYRISVYANPGQLAPFGSHIPASPIELECETSVEVDAGESAEVLISGFPEESFGPCVTA